MKNFFKIFVVVAGMAAAFYSCEPKPTAENQPDSTATVETAAPDSIAASTGDSTAVKADSANAGK